MNVAVTGSLSFDYIMDFSGRFADRIMPDKIHQISLSFLVDKLDKQFGGTAANIAYTLKLLGVQPVIVSCAGADFASYAAFLEQHRISLKYLAVHRDVATSAYFVVTDRDDNQIGSFYSGAMRYNRRLSLRQISEPLDFAVIAPNDPTAMVNHVQQAKAVKLPYLYDPAFQIGSFNRRQLQEGIEGATILVGNDYEIALIESKLGISHNDLRRLVPVVITTLGPSGSLVETPNQRHRIGPAKPKEVSDPTGAGDAYRAGFLAGYLRGLDLVTCGQMGSVAAAYTVEKYGTVTHTFTESQFKQRYETNYKVKLALS